MLTHTLKTPIESQRSGTINYVEVREPKVRDLKGLEAARRKGEMAATIYLTSALTGLSELDVEEMTSADFREVNKIIEGFFPESDSPPPTGE